MILFLLILGMSLLFCGFIGYHVGDWNLLYSFSISTLGFAINCYLSSRSWILECRRYAKHFASANVHRIDSIPEDRITLYNRYCICLIFANITSLLMSLVSFYIILQKADFSYGHLLGLLNENIIFLLVILLPIICFFSIFGLIILFQIRHNHYHQILIAINLEIVNQRMNNFENKHSNNFSFLKK